MDNDLIVWTPEICNNKKLCRPYVKKTRRNKKSSYLSLLCSFAMILCSICYAKNEGMLAVLSNKIINEMNDKIPISDLSSTPSSKPEKTTLVSATPIDLVATEQDGDKNETRSIYDYEPKEIPHGFYRIIPYDLTSEADGILKIFNESYFQVDPAEYAAKEQREAAINISKDEPTILIIHTHGTEGFSDKNTDIYSDTYNVPRSYDVSKNIIAVGRTMAEVFEKNGINTIHCDIMHDAESYLGAYARSAETIKRYIEAYPSICYIFDIHRDSVLLSDKTKTRPVTLIDGKTVAQIMTVVGTEGFGARHPEWKVNLEFALKLQSKMNENNIGFARSVCLRNSSYNQELGKYSLLFEVGSCGNSLDEAKEAGRILAEHISSMIKTGW